DRGYCYPALFTLIPLSCGTQRAIQICEDIVDVLNADRQAHIAFRHARSRQLFPLQLRMRCRRRMDGEAAHVADIGDMIEQLQAVDELATRFSAAFQLEAEQAAEAALEIGLRPSPFLAVR